MKKFAKLGKTGVTYRERLQQLIEWQILTVFAATVVVAAITGPFGTYDTLSLVFRFFYWACVLAFGFIACTLVINFCHVLMKPPKWPPIVPVVLGAVLASIPVWLVINSVNGAIFDGTGNALNPADLLIGIAVLSVVIGLTCYAVLNDVAQVAQTSRCNEAEVKLHRRMSQKFGTNIEFLSMHDHYVEVHTDKGSQLILMRFSDAISELDGIDGQQVHRSYWVAKDAVVSASRGRGGWSLTLTSGANVPVSRTFQPALMKAGWLD